MSGLLEVLGWLLAIYACALWAILFLVWLRDLEDKNKDDGISF